MTVKRKASVAIGALIATGLFSGAALAQAEFPTSAGKRADIGTYGTFDLNPGETQDIVSLKGPGTYRVCIIGKKSAMVVDGKNFNMDHGDCHDVEGSSIKMISDDSPGETSGYYHETGPRSRKRGMQ